MRSGHVTVAVSRKETREDTGFVAFAARQNRRDAGSNRTFANDKSALSGNQCLVPNLHTRHVGDCIQRSGRTVEWDSDIARPWLYGLMSWAALRKEKAWAAQ
jgi:hypothetical protein